MRTFNVYHINGGNLVLLNATTAMSPQAAIEHVMLQAKLSIDWKTRLIAYEFGEEPAGVKKLVKRREDPPVTVPSTPPILTGNDDRDALAHGVCCEDHPEYDEWCTDCDVAWQEHKALLSQLLRSSK